MHFFTTETEYTEVVLPFQHDDLCEKFVYLHHLHITLTAQASPRQIQHHLCLGCLQQYYKQHVTLMLMAVNNVYMPCHSHSNN